MKSMDIKTIKSAAEKAGLKVRQLYDPEFRDTEYEVYDNSGKCLGGASDTNLLVSLILYLCEKRGISNPFLNK